MSSFTISSLRSSSFPLAWHLHIPVQYICYPSSARVQTILNSLSGPSDKLISNSVRPGHPRQKPKLQLFQTSNSFLQFHHLQSIHNSRPHYVLFLSPLILTCSNLCALSSSSLMCTIHRFGYLNLSTFTISTLCVFTVTPVPLSFAHVVCCFTCTDCFLLF